ncbi:MAG: hypothetical protein OXD49_04975 [Candidatus Poribacteria bacterium]|nr:hypothetical protein [Candidatus Poribacteria bacterium]
MWRTRPGECHTRIHTVDSCDVHSNLAGAECTINSKIYHKCLWSLAQDGLQCKLGVCYYVRMRTLFHSTTIYFIFIMLMIWHVPDVPAIENPFEIRVFDSQLEVMQPYRLISGKHYRLQAVSVDEEVLRAQWFLAGNLGRITTGNQPTLMPAFVGEGDLICRVNRMEQRVRLSVVPATGTMGNRGGTLKSPAGVEITLPENALTIEKQIGIEIVASPGLPPTARQFIRVVQISPTRLVLKRLTQLTFLFGSDVFPDAKPQLYFWEAFGKQWVPLQSRVNSVQGGVTASINHFGIYTLMVHTPVDLERTDRFQIQNVKLSPRVFFAPDRNRLTIAYQLKAPEATQAFVTMDIFDLRGRRVRRLLEDTSLYVGPHIAQWDGLTDDGVLVRNGRYLLLIRARIGSQGTAHRKLVVVFK